MKRDRRGDERGSALLFVVVLIGAMIVVGMAAVSLSSQERDNAGAKARLDFARACGNAAQAKIWSELTDNGIAYLGSALQTTPVKLPDGTILTTGHYGAGAGNISVTTNVFAAKCDRDNPLAERDTTNIIVARTAGGNCYAIQARCIDPAGHEIEVEFGLRFAL